MLEKHEDGILMLLYTCKTYVYNKMIFMVLFLSPLHLKWKRRYFRFASKSNSVLLYIIGTACICVCEFMCANCKLRMANGKRRKMDASGSRPVWLDNRRLPIITINLLVRSKVAFVWRTNVHAHNHTTLPPMKIKLFGMLYASLDRKCYQPNWTKRQR